MYVLRWWGRPLASEKLVDEMRRQQRESDRDFGFAVWSRSVSLQIKVLVKSLLNDQPLCASRDLRMRIACPPKACLLAAIVADAIVSVAYS